MALSRAAKGGILVAAIIALVAVIAIPIAVTRGGGGDDDDAPNAAATPSPTDPNATLSAVQKPVESAPLPLRLARVARLPNVSDVVPKVNAIVAQNGLLYLPVNAPLALILRVDPAASDVAASMSVWLNVSDLLPKLTGRRVHTELSPIHGGLRGVAFPPDFPKTPRFYTSLLEDPRDAPDPPGASLVAPRNDSETDSVVLEWATDSDGAPDATKKPREVLRVHNPSDAHNIRQLRFGPDGLLYVGHGGGSKSTSPRGGQNADALGKILRMDPTEQSDGAPFGTPDNPFVGDESDLPDVVFAQGFRNPHNMCFSKDGELLVADVGRDNVEEINFVRAGGDYGWRRREGRFVELESGGLGKGVAALPADDARFNYTYPAVELGHVGKYGSERNGMSIALACPVENGSELDGLVLYANFGVNGTAYYSELTEMRDAVTKGKPEELTTATVYRMRVLFDDDDDVTTEPVELADLREVVRREKGFEDAERANIRWGMDADGSLYVSSKTNGVLYKVTNSEKTSRR